MTLLAALPSIFAQFCSKPVKYILHQLLAKDKVCGDPHFYRNTDILPVFLVFHYGAALKKLNKYSSI